MPPPLTDANRFSLKCPDAALLWDHEKNGDVTPGLVSYGSRRNMWWKCTKSHSWQDSVNSLSSGCGCPFCSGRRLSDQNRLSVTHPDIASEWLTERNIDTPDMFSFGSNKYKWWKCKRCSHEWEVTINNRTCGKGCPACAGTIVTDANRFTKLFPRVAAEWDHTKNSSMPETYSYGSNTVVSWKCSHLHTWDSSIGNRTTGGRNCPTCAGNIVSDTNRLSIVKPEVAREWDHALNTVPLESVSFSSTIMAHWVCANGHTWTATVHARRQTGCATCSRLILGTGTSMIETRIAAELSFIFADGSIEASFTRSIRVPEHLFAKASAIDTQYGTRFTTYGMRPDITFSGVFSDRAERLLIIEWDSALHETKILQDTAKTRILQLMRHAVIRLREAPLKCITDVCILVDKTPHSNKAAIKRAVDEFLLSIVPEGFAKLTKRVRRAIKEYLAAPTCQNQDVANAYLSQRAASLHAQNSKAAVEI
jgi:hypothetical protein